MKVFKALMGEKLFALMMKQTFYGHFVAGEDRHKIIPTLERWAWSGVTGCNNFNWIGIPFQTSFIRSKTNSWLLGWRRFISGRGRKTWGWVSIYWSIKISFVITDNLLVALKYIKTVIHGKVNVTINPNLILATFLKNRIASSMDFIPENCVTFQEIR